MSFLWFLWKYQGKRSKGLRGLSLDPKAVWQGPEPEHEALVRGSGEGRRRGVRAALLRSSCLPKEGVLKPYGYSWSQVQLGLDKNKRRHVS